MLRAQTLVLIATAKSRQEPLHDPVRRTANSVENPSGMDFLRRSAYKIDLFCEETDA